MFSFSSLPLTIFHVIGVAGGGGLRGPRRLLDLLQAVHRPGDSRLDVVHPHRQLFRRLNALGISILGEYVIRIYDQVRGRPPYIVDRTVNFAPPPGRLVRRRRLVRRCRLRATSLISI